MKQEIISCPGTEPVIPAPVGTVRFSALAKEWLRGRVPELKASSVAKYMNLLRSYLLPAFGRRDIGSITRGDVAAFSRKLLTSGGAQGGGLSPKTVNCALSVLKIIFRFAAREKGITVADIADISVKQPQKPMRILSRGEQEKLSGYLCADPTPCGLGILLCLYTGLRIGEICALKWEDICLEEQYIFVRRTMQRIQLPYGSVSGQSGADGSRRTGIIINEPKSGCSIRKIPVPDDIVRFLIPARAADDAFLLSGTSGRFIEPRVLENRFKAAAAQCGISGVNFHALRHTFATRCVELGFDIKSLSEILGHAGVTITLNRYVHPSMELKKKNMDMLSELLPLK